MSAPMSIAETAADIREDFSWLEDWEARYAHIIDLGKANPPLEPHERTEETRVRGCASQVWLVFDAADKDRISFRGDSDAHIVKGLVALLHALYDGKSPEEVLATDARAALSRIELEDHITPQRSNGLTAMIGTIRAVAEQAAL